MVTTKVQQDEGKHNTFYFAMALLFALAAVIGFAPNSIAILNGAKENPPLLIHLHAASMSLWMALLVVQSGLAGRGHMRLHMALGQASFLLAPTVFLLIVAIALPGFFSDDTPLAGLIIQTKRIVFFAGCIGVAIWLRKASPDVHKRLIFIGTFAVLDAAFFRMSFLPDWGFERAVTIGHLNMTALLIPFLIYDRMRLARIHQVYWITVPPLLAFHLAAAMSW